MLQENVWHIIQSIKETKQIDILAGRQELSLSTVASYHDSAMSVVMHDTLPKITLHGTVDQSIKTRDAQASLVYPER